MIDCSRCVRQKMKGSSSSQSQVRRNVYHNFRQYKYRHHNYIHCYSCSQSQLRIKYQSVVKCTNKQEDVCKICKLFLTSWHSCIETLYFFKRQMVVISIWYAITQILSRLCLSDGQTGTYQSRNNKWPPTDATPLGVEANFFVKKVRMAKNAINSRSTSMSQISWSTSICPRYLDLCDVPGPPPSLIPKTPTSCDQYAIIVFSFPIMVRFPVKSHILKP